MWFPDEGDPRHGTPDDPRMVLIGVDIHAVVFFQVDKPKPVVLYEMARGWLTGSQPDVGEMHRIRGAARSGVGFERV
jgi:hypothetical protein